MAIFQSKAAKCDFSHLSGIEQLRYKAVVRLTQSDEQERLEIKELLAKEEPLFLNYAQITGCGIVKDLKIKKDGNNAVGNAILGGLILGPLGAIVGGMSGIGSNEIIIKKCFIINYHPASNPEDTNAILLEVVNASWKWEKFIENLTIKTGGPLPEKSKQL